MLTTSDTRLSELAFRTGIVLNVSVFFLMTGYGLLSGYSYWFDELISVVWSNSDFHTALRETFNDVHPPLYQALLWLWIGMFGDSESATRGFSALLAAGAIALLFLVRNCMARNVWMLLLLCFSANPFLFYYAQETRSYALLLFLSTLLMTFQLRGNPAAVIGASLALGLTHYFGLFLATCALAHVLLRRRIPGVLLFHAVMALLLIWPVAQLLVGGGSDQVGGQFWIRTTPLESILHGFHTGFPVVFEVSEIALRYIVSDQLASAFLLLIFAAFLGGALWVGAREQFGESASEGVKAAQTVTFMVASLVVLVFVISTHTPISTRRNFIVLVPYGSFLIAVLLAYCMRRSRLTLAISTCVCIGLVVGGLVMAQKQVRDKTAPWQDWRETVNLGWELAERNQVPLFHIGDGSISSKIYNYYSSRMGSMVGVDQNDIAELPDEFVLIYGHRTCREIDQLLDEIESFYEVTDNMFIRQGAGCNIGANGAVLARR